MKEKRSKEKHKSHKKAKSKKHEKKEKKKRYSSSSSSTSVDEWVEKAPAGNQKTEREDWMAMTGMLKTYTKDDVRPKREEKDKKHIDSYNPATSSRELNPYWKDGGSGVPQTAESFRQSVKFLEPPDDEDYYSRSSDRKSSNNTHFADKSKSSQLHKPTDVDDYYSHDKRSSYKNDSRQFLKPPEDEDYYKSSSHRPDKPKQFLNPYEKDDYYRKSNSSRSESQSRRNDREYRDRNSEGKSYNWKKGNRNTETSEPNTSHNQPQEISEDVSEPDHEVVPEKAEQKSGKYLSDEKLNKLAAKIVKAEIMGDTKLVTELKEKLEAAREFRKQNPDAKPDDEDDGIMLIATNSSGNSRPLTNTAKGDPRSKGGKRKADTHVSGERAKYFGNDDKYNLAQMFQNEKYGNNYNDEAELAKIASKSKNPNDDLENIFMDEISKNRSETKDAEVERSRAIKQHQTMEKSLEGCEYCLESKNMLKHLMVSCASKVYVAVPSRKSLVNGHCLISTIQHSTCVTALDEDVWEEIMDYRKALTQLFNSQGQDVVFFETATRLHKFPHMVINCVPLPRDVGDMAAIYFKKALLECEAEWSMNKKVVELKGKNIRKGVPKGLPYFWIDFGMDPGFAHVIEDQQLFPKTFAQEVIAGILDLDHSHWKNTKKEFGEMQRKKVLDFINDWKPFDPIKKE